MKQFFLVVAIVLTLTVSLFAAYPYDSVAEVTTPFRDGHNGGSATLIAVSETKALVLTCQHVVLRAGRPVEFTWHATGEVTQGTVISVGAKRLDIALCITDRPKDLRAVPIAKPDLERSGQITNAGYPGLKGVLQWQTGEIERITQEDLYYTCRPVPGMSGGPTFDQYGNLIGVVVRYGRDGGASTSGKRMVEYLRPYMQKDTSAWAIEPIAFPDLVVAGPPETEIQAPEDWEEFELYVFLEYILPQIIEETSWIFEQETL